MMTDAMHALYGALIAASIIGIWLLRPRTSRARRIRLVLGLFLLVGVIGLGAALRMTDQRGPTGFATSCATKFQRDQGDVEVTLTVA